MAGGILEWVQTTQAIITLLVSGTSALVALIYWFHRRMKAVALEANREASAAHSTMASRLGKVEEQLDVTRKEMHQLGSRVGGIERTLETVARQSDVAELRAVVSEFRGTVSAQLVMATGQIDTLYKAALRSSKQGNA